MAKTDRYHATKQTTNWMNAENDSTSLSMIERLNRSLQFENIAQPEAIV